MVGRKKSKFHRFFSIPDVAGSKARTLRTRSSAERAFDPAPASWTSGAGAAGVNVIKICKNFLRLFYQNILKMWHFLFECLLYVWPTDFCCLLKVRHVCHGCINHYIHRIYGIFFDSPPQTSHLLLTFDLGANLRCLIMGLQDHAKSYS